jgi:hypothetical protein
MNKWTKESITSEFRTPISFCEEKSELDLHIKTDLELNCGDNPIYKNLLKPKTTSGKLIVNCWDKYYTKDKRFLKDTQKLLDRIDYDNNDSCDKMIELYEEIQQDNNFVDKYNYIDWNYLEFLNSSSYFLCFLSVYNIFSPLIALCLPIILMIVPFIILKIQGIPVTWSVYVNTLMFLFRNNVIGQLLMNFKSVSWDKRVYMIVSCGMYFMQIYNNILSCFRFNTNMKKIHHIFEILKNYNNYTINEIEKLEKNCKSLESYKEFNKLLLEKKEHLVKISSEIEHIEQYKWNTKEAMNLGVIMRQFYQLYKNEDIQNTLTFTFGLHGYLENMQQVSNLIKSEELHICKYNNKGKTSFSKAFYPLVAKKSITNNYNLNKNIIITGPNASGKTTLLKTTMINIILSQQFGCGYYKKASIDPYEKIHCYLNIPDTSGRDSLFQAEARRCMNILEYIENNKNKRHFCAFDELYSGTNPYEAVATGVSYIEHLSNLRNVDLMLTTHFIDLCNHLSRNKKIENMKMNINVLGNREFEYLYKLSDGISEIKGGVKVLKDLKYPPSIIARSENILDIC